MEEARAAEPRLDSHGYRTRAVTDPAFVLPPAHVTNLGIDALLDGQRLAFLTGEIGYRDGGVAMKQLTMRFLAALDHPATVDLGLAVARIGTTSFILRQTVFLGLRPAATGESVFINLEGGAPAPIAPARRALLEAFAGA